MLIMDMLTWGNCREILSETSQPTRMAFCSGTKYFCWGTLVDLVRMEGSDGCDDIWNWLRFSYRCNLLELPQCCLCCCCCCCCCCWCCCPCCCCCCCCCCCVYPCCCWCCCLHEVVGSFSWKLEHIVLLPWRWCRCSEHPENLLLPSTLPPLPLNSPFSGCMHELTFVRLVNSSPDPSDRNTRLPSPPPNDLFWNCKCHFTVQLLFSFFLLSAETVVATFTPIKITNPQCLPTLTKPDSAVLHVSS